MLLGGKVYGDVFLPPRAEDARLSLMEGHRGSAQDSHYLQTLTIPLLPWLKTIIALGAAHS